MTSRMLNFLSKSNRSAGGSPASSSVPAQTTENVKAAQRLVIKHPNLQKIFWAFDRIAVQLGQLDRLADLQVNWDKQLTDTLEAPYFEEVSERQTLGDYLARIDMPQLLCEMYAKLMKVISVEWWTELQLSQLSEIPQTAIIFRIRYLLANYSGASVLFGEQLSASGIFKYYMKDLQAMEADIPNMKEMNSIIESAMGAIHNCSINPANHQHFHRLGVVTQIVPYLKCQSGKVKMMVLLTLAYIMDDDENRILQANKTIFMFLVRYLVSAWKSPNHRHEGFSLEELLAGMVGLAKNDHNKREFLPIGTLHILTVILKLGSLVERQPAVELLWELAFNKDNRRAILANRDVVEMLISLSESENKSIARAANGAWWVLNTDERERQLAQTGSRPEKNVTGHIVISYASSDLNKVIQIKEYLHALDYGMWLNVDHVLGTLLEAAVAAVDRASVVLVCVSNSYKQSLHCRTEAEYAFSVNKDIIPLLLEQGYEPDGWLENIRVNRLYFDLSGKFPFESKMKQLVKELGMRGKIQQDVQLQQTQPVTMATSFNKAAKAVAAAISVKRPLAAAAGNAGTTSDAGSVMDATNADNAMNAGSSVNSTNTTNSTNTVNAGNAGNTGITHKANNSVRSSWSRKDVQNWLHKVGLKNNMALVTLTGEQLGFLHELSTRAPEFYFNYLERNLGLNTLEELMRFSKAVDQL